MESKQIMFFVLLEDICPILMRAEVSFEINYSKMGLFDNRNIAQFQSAFKIPNFGYTFSGDWNRTDRYLIVPKNSVLNVQDYPQRNGSVKYAVDQSTNEESVELKVGGVYKEVDNVLVAGRIGTISNDDFSLQIFEFFSSVIRKEFTRIGAFYVGKNAKDKLRLGWRLVTNEKLSKEYDLIQEE